MLRLGIEPSPTGFSGFLNSGRPREPVILPANSRSDILNILNILNIPNLILWRVPDLNRRCYR